MNILTNKQLTRIFGEAAAVLKKIVDSPERKDLLHSLFIGRAPTKEKKSFTLVLTKDGFVEECKTERYDVCGDPAPDDYSIRSVREEEFFDIAKKYFLRAADLEDLYTKLTAE